MATRRKVEVEKPGEKDAASNGISEQAEKLKRENCHDINLSLHLCDLTRSTVVVKQAPHVYATLVSLFLLP